MYLGKQIIFLYSTVVEFNGYSVCILKFLSSTKVTELLVVVIYAGVVLYLALSL